jgi:sensor domain CHASE-containing protein
MDDERQRFAEQGARLIDSVNRLMLFAALIVFYFLLTPILYNIEKSSRNTTEQVEALTNEVKTLEQRLLERLEDPESWQKTKEPIMDRSAQSYELQNN